MHTHALRRAVLPGCAGGLYQGRVVHGEAGPDLRLVAGGGTARVEAPVDVRDGVGWDQARPEGVPLR